MSVDRSDSDTVGPRGAALPAATLLIGITALAAALGLWHVSRSDLYTSGSSLGYALGVVGGCMMLGLLTYPVRKRIPVLGNAGPLRHWFRAHMALGILGPMLILFHSKLHVGSLNAAVALSCMLLVAASGIVGRFIYRQIHHGLYGARATVDELQASLERQMQALEPALLRAADARAAVDEFSSRTHRVPATLGARTLHFIGMYIERPLVRRRVRRALGDPAPDAAPRSALRALDRTIDALLSAVLRHAQFSTYERLFSLWHVAHLPFVYMLAASAIVHVVAVHMY